MPNVTKEDLVLNDKIKFDNKGGEILGVLEGPVADFMHPTRNGRDYSEKLWENVWKNPLVQEQFANGGIVGELDHPADRDDICTEKVAILMPEPPVKKNGEYYGKFNILNTPCGKIVYTLAKAGFKLGVSSRGTGDVDEYTNEVDPDTYEFTCFDVVLLPAVKTARMNLVTESLDTTKKVNYKELLKECIDNSSEADKKVMEETLSNLDINLTEDVKDNEKEHVCCICGKKFKGYGNNPAPVKFDGICCDDCNWAEVIPARLKALDESYKLEVKGPNDQDYREPNQAGDDAHIQIDADTWKKVEDKTSKDPVEWDCNGWACRILKEAAPLVDVEAEAEVVPAAEVPAELEASEEEVHQDDENKEKCTEHDAKLIGLLHKFIEAQGIEYENDEEAKNMEDSFLELYHETFPDVCNPEEDADKSNEDDQEDQTEAEDDGSLEIIEQLQNTLKENKSLKEEVKLLQDEKAVSDTKVKKLTEDLTSFKAVAASAGKKALGVKELENENKTLSEQVTSLKEELSKKDEKDALQESRISKLIESKKVLEEKLEVFSDDSAEVVRLQEELRTVKEDSDKKLLEQTNRSEKLTKLVEKYKDLAHDVANRYIESKALSLGITVNEIKNRLNESYSLDDVDRVCEELQSYSLNISRLPFAFDKPGAKIRIREDKSKDPLKEVDSEYDDTVDDYLLDLAGLRK